MQQPVTDFSVQNCYDPDRVTDQVFPRLLLYLASVKVLELMTDLWS